MKILLIAGHGAGDSGAVAKIDGKTYKEADLTREVVANLKPLLKEYGAEVDVYPTTHDAYKDITKSGAFAVDVSKYNYALEVHFNSAAKDLSGNGVTTGSEIFVTYAEGGTTVEQKILSKLAAVGFKNRGVKRTDYAVIRNIKRRGASSALLEVCFVDDADDMKLFMSKADKTCAAIADGIAEGFGLKKVKTASAPKLAPTTVAKVTKAAAPACKVKVTASALNIRAGAGTGYKVTGVIRDKGVYTITEKKNGWGKLKNPPGGAGWISLAYTKEVK